MLIHGPWLFATTQDRAPLQFANAALVVMAVLLLLLVIAVAALMLGRRMRSRSAAAPPRPQTSDPWTESARRIYVDPPPSHQSPRSGDSSS